MKDISIQSSAYSSFHYKDLTGRSWLDDLNYWIKNADKIKKNLAKGDLSGIDDLLTLILNVSYVLYSDGDQNNNLSFEEFLKRIDGMFDDSKWIDEVLTCAVSPFSRQLQATK